MSCVRQGYVSGGMDVGIEALARAPLISRPAREGFTTRLEWQRRIGQFDWERRYWAIACATCVTWIARRDAPAQKNPTLPDEQALTVWE